MPATPILVLEKALRLLAEVAADQGQTSLTELARRSGIAPATAHRIAATLRRQGVLVKTARGAFMIGPALIAMSDPQALRRAIKAIGAPIVRALARRTGLAAHLGVLEEEMVTYLVKSGRGSARLFTEEGMQLEAYCSGIGKALLAHLREPERERYLAGGPFVRLTPRTIIDPVQLREELARVRARGYAIDDCEIDKDLRCIAAPVRDPSGDVVAAISISARAKASDPPALDKHHPSLSAAVHELECALYPSARSTDDILPTPNRHVASDAAPTFECAAPAEDFDTSPVAPR